MTSAQIREFFSKSFHALLPNRAVLNKITDDNGTLKYNGSTVGITGQTGQTGATGASAYQTWLAQSGNEGKTEAQFLASLKGEKGDDGESFVWYETYASVSAMNADAANVPTGKCVLINTNDVSDEDNAKVYRKGESGFTFLVDLSGTAGANGKSAYQSWLDQGNSGTEADFVASLGGGSSSETVNISNLVTGTVSDITALEAGYERVVPEGNENPSTAGWYERGNNDSFTASSDVTVDSSKTYYTAVSQS